MKAITHDRYGSPDTLKLRDLPEPDIGESDVLIRAHAASLHPGDLFSVLGSPFPVRLMTGLRRPKLGIPGFDVAGTVAAVGPRVGDLSPGDEVFGVGDGTCAELVRAPADLVIRKPANLSFAEAAAIPTSALAAMHGLRDAGRVQPGQRVLINGASGGVGTFAVQIAKVLGAHVTGICSGANAEMVRSLGADVVIDYTRTDFTAGPARYDLILDNIENRRLAEVRRALAPRGTLVLNSGTGATGLRMLARLLWPLVLSPFTGHNLRRYVSNPRRADLEWLAARAAVGSIRPVVGSTFALSEVPTALQRIASGHARGKTVVRIGQAAQWMAAAGDRTADRTAFAPAAGERHIAALADARCRGWFTARMRPSTRRPRPRCRSSSTYGPPGAVPAAWWGPSSSSLRPSSPAA
jgi:NADPH:quinone reductase-like Zn-dependent oxidoreductase